MGGIMVYQTDFLSILTMLLLVKKSTIDKTGTTTCVKTLAKDQTLKSAKGARKEQNITPVIVMDTVKIYFKRLKILLVLCVTFFLSNIIAKIKEVIPIHKLESWVKYNSLVNQW